MTIEEAIGLYEESEKINKELAKTCVSPMSKNHNIENAEKCRQMIEWLRELQDRRKRPEQRWIPCSERLPEEEIEVLVTRKFLGCKDVPPSTYVEVAQYFCGEWEALSDEYKIARNRHTNPIAWMPLPKPYKEGEQDE